MTPIDQEQIKAALNSFTDDDFVTAKEILSREIRGARDEFLAQKLELKPSEIESEDENEDDENEDDEDEDEE